MLLDLFSFYLVRTRNRQHREQYAGFGRWQTHSVEYTRTNASVWMSVDIAQDMERTLLYVNGVFRCVSYTPPSVRWKAYKLMWWVGVDVRLCMCCLLLVESAHVFLSSQVHCYPLNEARHTTHANKTLKPSRFWTTNYRYDDARSVWIGFAADGDNLISNIQKTVSFCKIDFYCVFLLSLSLLYV